MLTIIVGFGIEFNKCFSPQEELRREEFILVQQVRIEPQIAKRLTLEGISARTNPKVSMLKEVLPSPLTVSAERLLPLFQCPQY